MAEKFYLITEEERKLLLAALHDAYYMQTEDMEVGIEEAEGKRQAYERLEAKLEKMRPRTILSTYRDC
jgi:hypothetical protein